MDDGDGEDDEGQGEGDAGTKKIVACQTAPFCHAVFDSGQSLMSVPADVYELLHTQLMLTPNNTCEASVISKLPTLVFRFSAPSVADGGKGGKEKADAAASPGPGVEFELRPEDYILRANGPNAVGGSACFVGITPLQLPDSMGTTPMWVFGNLFLRRFYSVYDREQNRIGLAEARPERD